MPVWHLGQPLFGAGQGAEPAPTVWNLEHSHLLDCMPEHAIPITFTSPDQTIASARTSDGFVDDTTNWTNLSLQVATLLGDDPTTLAKQIQDSAQWWEELLSAAGGKLELDKCFFCVVVWTFDHEGSPRLRTCTELEDIEVELLSSITGDIERIQQRDCHKHHRTLGVHESPSLDPSFEKDRLRNRIDSLVQAIRPAKLNPHEMWVFCRSVHQKSVGCSAPVADSTEQEWTTLECPVRTTVLNGLGCSRTTEKSVVCSPMSSGGVGLTHGFVEQGIQHILSLQTHLRLQGPAQQLLRTTLLWWQHVSGLSVSILERPDVPLPHLPGPLIHTIRSFLDACGCHTILADSIATTPLREHDISLMDHATLHSHHTSTEIKADRKSVV